MGGGSGGVIVGVEESVVWKKEGGMKVLVNPGPVGKERCADWPGSVGSGCVPARGDPV